MANGDIAAAAGLPVVTPTADVRLGYDEINRTRDQVAVHMTTGTHTWDNVTGKPTTFPPAAHDHGNTVVKSYIGQDVRLRQDGAGRLGPVPDAPRWDGSSATHRHARIQRGRRAIFAGWPAPALLPGSAKGGGGQ